VAEIDASWMARIIPTSAAAAAERSFCSLFGA
jgi:hypothetical protein